MEISDWIWAPVGVVELGWAARLWRLGLARSYPFLTSYLVFSAVHSAVSFAAYNTWGRNSAAYGQLWAVTQPVLWVMLFCVVIEAYNHMLRGYEGLQRLGQWGSHIVLGTVALIVLAMVVLDPPVDGAVSPWGIFWVHQERSVYLGLTAICLGNSGFVVGEHGFGPAPLLDSVDAAIPEAQRFRARMGPRRASVHGGAEGRAGDAPLLPKWLITMDLRQKNRFNECKECGCESASNHTGTDLVFSCRFG